MMEGFRVHTFLVNAQEKSTFVKFHWKPLFGLQSLVWDEAQQWDAIEEGNAFEWELGIQTLAEEEQKYDFDILDATKL